jgi:hypothetical protein
MSRSMGTTEELQSNSYEYEEGVVSSCCFSFHCPQSLRHHIHSQDSLVHRLFQYHQKRLAAFQSDWDCRPTKQKDIFVYSTPKDTTLTS